MKIPEILQVETSQVPGSLASVLNVIAEAGLVLEHVTTVHREQGRTLWEITVEVEPGKENDLLDRLNKLSTARFMGWSDRVFDRHRGGKIEVRSRIPISTQQILRDIYTPGVARVCLAIQEKPERVFKYTWVVAGRGHHHGRLGDPRARQHRRPAGVAGDRGQGGAVCGAAPASAACRSWWRAAPSIISWTWCGPIAPSFGAILLEDIAAPRCFEIEHKLRAAARHPGAPR